MQHLIDDLINRRLPGRLVIFQAMGTAGKDGTIEHVISGVKPQGFEVHSFKKRISY